VLDHLITRRITTLDSCSLEAHIDINSKASSYFCISVGISILLISVSSRWVETIAVNYCVVTERLVGNVTLTFRRLHFDSSDETNSVKAMEEDA